MDETKDRAAILLALMESFGREMGEAACEVYLAALADVPLADLKRAATQAMRGSKFFPPAAEIRSLAGIAAPPLDDLAIRAWAVAWRSVSEHGAYVSVAFDQTTMRAIAAMGGWPAFCHPAQDLEWHRKEFLESFRGLTGQHDSEISHLPGINENGPTNRALGRAPAVIVVIGGEERKRIANEPARMLSTSEANQFLGEIKRRADDAALPTAREIAERAGKS